MDSQNKESFWKQVFMRLHVTDDDRAIFPAGSVLPLDVTTARPLVGDEEGSHLPGPPGPGGEGVHRSPHGDRKSVV